MITREVSAGDVKGAEFQNFSNLGDASRRVISQAGMKGLHPDSPAYGRLMSTLMSNEASQRAAGRDPYRNANDSTAAVAAAAPQVLQYAPVRAAYRALGMDVPEPQRPVRQAGGATAPGPVWNAGSVNGKAVMAPTPGNYGNMLEQRRRVGLTAPNDTGIASYNNAQDDLAERGYSNAEMSYEQQAAAGDVNAQKALAAAQHKRQVELNDQQREHARQLELERTKNQPEMLKAGMGDTKALQSWHGEQVQKWNNDQIKANALLGRIQGVPDKDPETGAPNRVVVDDEGHSMTVEQVRAQAQAMQYQQPTYQESLMKLGTPEAMQELTRQGKQMGQEPAPDQGGNWLSDAVDSGMGMAKRAGEQVAKQRISRRQTLSQLTPKQMTQYNNATPEQQAEFWRQVEAQQQQGS